MKLPDYNEHAELNRLLIAMDVEMECSECNREDDTVRWERTDGSDQWLKFCANCAGNYEGEEQYADDDCYDWYLDEE